MPHLIDEQVVALLEDNGELIQSAKSGLMKIMKAGTIPKEIPIFPTEAVDKSLVGNLISTWTLDPEWMHLKTALGHATIEHDYRIDTHEHLYVLRLPAHTIESHKDAGKFMIEMKNIFETADSPSDLFMGLSLLMNKVEAKYD